MISSYWCRGHRLRVAPQSNKHYAGHRTRGRGLPHPVQQAFEGDALASGRVSESATHGRARPTILTGDIE